MNVSIMIALAPGEDVPVGTPREYLERLGFDPATDSCSLSIGTGYAPPPPEPAPPAPEPKA